MGSQLLSILRQGFWASLTGGWYYDQRQCHFSNVFHLYIWLLLLCLPLSIEIFLKSLFATHFTSWLLYCCIIGGLFSSIKLVNAYLHHLYDTGECIAEPEQSIEEVKDENEDEKRNNSASFSKFDDESRVCSLVEALEETNKLSSTEFEACRRENVIPMKLMTSSRTQDTREDVSTSEKSASTVKQLNMSSIIDHDMPSTSKEKILTDSKNSVQCNVTLHPSVIDLEVDVHHRNSSGSSIAACGSVSSSSAASGRLTATTTIASAIGNSPAAEKEDKTEVTSPSTESGKVKKKPSAVSVGASNNSLSNGSSEEVVTTTQSASSEALLKGSSFGELGFMAQDPSVMRNIVAGSHQDNQLRSYKPNGRSEAGFSGRRARSELETTNCYSGENNQGTLMPPSHPVSLEVIGTSCETSDLAREATRSNKSDQKRIKFSSVEVLNHHRKGSLLGTTKSTSVINDTINPIDELSADEQTKQDTSPSAEPSEASTGPKTSSVILSETKPDINEEEESDVSLVVNLSSKQASEANAIPQQIEQELKNDDEPPKSHVQREDAGPSCQTTSRIPQPSASDSSFSDNKSGDSSSGCSSDDNEGDDDNDNDSWTSRHSTVSCSRSETDSDNEKTPLTASTSGQILPRPRPYNITAGRSKTHLSLSPCTPGGSQDIKMRMIGMLLGKEGDRTELDLRKPKTESEKRRKRQQMHKMQDHTRYKKVEASVEEIPDGYQQLIGAEAALSPSPAQAAAPSASEGPPAYLLARVLALPNTHLAKSHDDTTIGAVHCFQDECGNWLAYIFDANSMGTARGLMSSDSKNYFNCYSSTSFQAQKWDSPSSSESNVVLDAPTNILHTPRQALESRTINSVFGNDDNMSNHNFARFLTPTSSLFAETFPITAFSPLRTSRRIEINPNVMLAHQGSCAHALNSNLTDISFPVQLRLPDFASPEPTPPKTKQYYKLWIPPCLNWKYVKIWFDRLQLLALLDRSFTYLELLISVALAVMVAVSGSLVIESGLFQDLSLFLFCFVIASCQYTLLKSVQPDAASPTHGYNRIIIYSRPVYFILTCAIILFCKRYVESSTHASFTVYKMNMFSPKILHVIGEATKLFVLAFPVIFTVGLLPQVNTFLMHLLEQIDIHVFGGTAATMGLTSSIYCITRSLLTVGFLYGFALISTANLVSKSNPDYDVVFSVFCGFLVFLAYHLSRSSSDPMIYWNIIKKRIFHEKKKADNVEDQKKVEEEEVGEAPEKEYVDPLPAKMEETLLGRLENDIILAVLVIVVVFAIHVSTIFRLQPLVGQVLNSLAVTWGFSLHYFIANFRKELPWLCFSRPLLKSREYNMFEVKEAAKLMWFERLQSWMWLIEKSVIYPLVFLSAITVDTPILLKERGVFLGTFVVVICTFKGIRSSFNDSSHNHLILLFTYLFFDYDFYKIKEPFLVNFFVTSIAYHKFYEFLLKMRFIVTYVAPWQITWGSAFHAFAQPFSVPHSGLLFVQAAISSVLSSPLQPLLGSAIFLISYVRPVKFWERDYNTKRVDHSNTRLINQLERNQLGNDDNNLNSIFYEHLTRSLQHSLYGDLALGRWGPVSQGDVFVLASDNLNCLLHIIELGNGLCTFQVRGLEFRGTYCQQREVEAISEGANEDEGCCCCEPGHLPGMLSVNAAFNQRWLAWEVTNTKYVLEGYSISDNSALSMLQPYDLRKALITYYVKCVIYYTTINKRLQSWCKLDAIEAMEKDKDFVDFDITFNVSVDEDYDFISAGITRERFRQTYQRWIRFCLIQRNLNLSEEEIETVITLCFCLSLLARRALSAASHHNSFNSVEFLLYGLHSLFKGDFRVTSARDEWVFQDITLLNSVVAPSVRMALKLHQDHFMSTEEYEDDAVLYASISNYRKEYVISHEADPAWRNAVLSNVPSLLALRHVFDDGTDQYKIIMLNKRYLNFRVIKVNRECVRGLWAGQQQELVYLRNRNPERGSIQNAKQALRNIINSSCDQPIGYPIYVSPLTTSFAETSEALARVLGKPLSFGMFKRVIVRFWNRIRTRCGEGCSSGGAGAPGDINPEEIVMRSMSSIATCRHHRQDFCRGTNHRGHRRSSFNEYESSQLLQNCRSKTMVHPSMAYQQLQRSRRHNSSLNSSTLVNLSAFRPLDPQEMETVVVRGSRSSVSDHQQQMSTVALTTEQAHHRSRGELV